MHNRQTNKQTDGRKCTLNFEVRGITRICRVAKVWRNIWSYLYSISNLRQAHLATTENNIVGLQNCFGVMHPRMFEPHRGVVLLIPKQNYVSDVYVLAISWQSAINRQNTARSGQVTGRARVMVVGLEKSQTFVDPLYLSLEIYMPRLLVEN